MALCSTLSPPSSLSRLRRHDVFPSFHGPDVRKTFLSHVMKEFKKNGIDTFIDNDIERSKSIGHELIEAINGSKIAIVLLSKNYASSTWCLNELVEIMRCRKDLDQTVMTVFYEVDPTDVKKQTGDFGEKFKETCKGKSKDDILIWKQALVEVATIAGEHSANWVHEADMIEKIATDISNKLNIAIPSRDFDDLIGMKAHMEIMEPLLRIDLNDEVRMIGIWGPPGIGKTTIARFMFDRFSEKFGLGAIIVNIRGCYPRGCNLDDYGAQVQFHRHMLSELFNRNDIVVPHLGVAQKMLRDKKVLLVLDEVDQIEQLQAVEKATKCVGSGSRIIITTENLRVLKAHKIDHIYKVDFPSTNEAFQIFCMNAFGQEFPEDDFRELAWEVTRLVGELPLGLKVMGSHFKGMSKHEWIDALPRLRTRLDANIQSVLKFSYDALCDEDKDLFLHIACFFNHQKFKRVKEHLKENIFDVAQGFRVLAEKSLISIDGWGHIEMHKLLEQLGREINCKKSIYETGQRPFFAYSRDICNILGDDTTMDRRSIIGITHDLSNIKGKLNKSKRALEGMPNLQFLMFENYSNEPNNVYLPRGQKLKLLHWQNYPMTCLPSRVNTRFFVELNMPLSNLQKLWKGIQPLSNLKWMDLNSSYVLKKLPNLSTATNLKELNLSDCSRLVEIPSSIGNATSLKRLNLKNCSSLVKIPSSIGKATNLKELDFSGCSSITKLPSSIGNLQKLWRLTLRGCSKIEALPININLKSLDTLHLGSCSRLKTFPQISTNIKFLHLYRTAIKEVPSSTRSWSRLCEFVINGCRKLISLSQLPDSLSILDAENCESLERIDCSFRNPDIRLNFRNCFKLNQESRDLIIQTSTREFAVLPGGEVPAYFTFQASGNSLTVNLNERLLPASKKLKACILIGLKGEYVDGRWAFVKCRITSKQNSFSASTEHYIRPVLTKHLYTFEVALEQVTSTELDFEFSFDSYYDEEDMFKIEECGILELLEVPSCG